MNAQTRALVQKATAGRSLAGHAQRSVLTPAQTGLHKRKCACGGTAGLDGECAMCRARRLARQQAKSPPPGASEPAFAAPGVGYNFGQVPIHALDQAPQTASPAREAQDGVAQSPDQAVEEARFVQRLKAKGPPGEAEPEILVNQESDQEQAEEVEEEPEEEAEGVEGARASAPAAAAAEEPMTEAPRTKESIVFRTVDDMTPSTTGLTGKAKCPAPTNAPVGFSTRRSTAAQIAAMSACNWGITSPDPLKISTSTCKDGAVWRLRVRRVTSIVRTFSRQLAGQAEPTVASSTAANFCNQVSDLDNLGNCAGNWYMLAAVRAHEAVHVTEWTTSFGSDWPAQKAIIEGLNVPASGATKSRRAATASMRSSVAFLNALQTDNASGNYPAFWGIADPNVNTDAAERVIVAPRIKQICVRARDKGWAPAACAVCAANGIT